MWLELFSTVQVGTLSWHGLGEERSLKGLKTKRYRTKITPWLMAGVIAPDGQEHTNEEMNK